MKRKGRAVLAKRSFTKGEFICEYAGELITHVEGQHRDQVYAKDPLTGHLGYMYYFQFEHPHNKKWW